MEMREFFERAELFDRRGLLERRSGWTDRLPGSRARVIAAGTKRSRWHWSLILPAPLVERYRLWLARQRYRLDIEQINIDEIDDFASMVEDTSEVMRAIQEKHAIRRQMARFHVASRERVILERLARRWDVDAPRMIDRGNVNEQAIAQVRRAVREARWTWRMRCAQLLVPALSLLVALAAVLK